MSKLSPANLIRGLILASLATLMVAGFLVLGGLSSSDSAEGFGCSKRWFSRCNFETSATEDLEQTNTTVEVSTTGTFDEIVISTSTRRGGFLNCDKRWFNRCFDVTEDTSFPPIQNPD